MRPDYRWIACILTALLAALGPVTAPGEASEGSVPEEYRPVALGETVDFGTGNTITVSAWEEDVPFKSDGMLGELEGVASLFKARICAGPQELESFAAESFFSLSRPLRTGHEFRQAFPTEGIREPRFNDGPLPESIAAGTCHEGWVVIAAPDATTVHPGTNAIIFDNTAVSFIPDELDLKLAWTLD